MSATPARRNAIVLLTTAGLAGAWLTLSGCSTTGKHTSRDASQAKQTLAVIKSATEWDMARQAFLAGDLEKALKGVDRSIALNENVPKSHVLRGRVLMEKGDIEGAIDSFNTAETLDPSNYDAQYFLGVAFERLAQPERAQERYVRAADLDPSNPQYVIAAAEMMLDLGRASEAMSFLEGRQSAFEHNGGVRHLLGQIAMIEGDSARAERLFTEARLLTPDDTMINEDLVRALIANAEFGEAESLLARMLKDPANADRRDLEKLRARCLIETDRLVEAREVYIRLTRGQEGVNDAEAWLELGNISYMLKDDVRARQGAMRAIALAPSRGEGYVLRALVERRAGDLKGAAATLELGAQRAPEDSSVRTLQAVVKAELDNPEAARLAIAEALRLDPDNTAAKRLLSAVGGE
jgi:Flp pilus assembly protein TadD